MCAFKNYFFAKQIKLWTCEIFGNVFFFALWPVTNIRRQVQSICLWNYNITCYRICTHLENPGIFSHCTRPWKSFKFSFIHFGPLKSLFDLRNIFKPPKNLGKYQFEANRIKLTSRKWRSGMDCLWCERLRSRMITSHLVPWFVPCCRGVVWDFKYVHTERKSSGKWVH